MRVQPLVLVGGVAGFALGRYRSVITAKAGGGSGGDKKQMSCDEALGQAQAAAAVATILLALDEPVYASFVSGYAMGIMNASCPDKE